jgi:hypothetical protein
VLEGSRGVFVAAGFFALGGVLDIGFAVFLPSQPGFWGVWEAAGRSLVSLVVAFGLLRRLAFFRYLAAIYCVAMLLTYGAVLLLAYSGTDASFSRALILQSLYEIPACGVLLPYFRSPEAQEAFSQPLIRS